MQIQAHDRKDVRLYYGTRNTGATAYSDLDDSWKAAGVDIVHVYSDEDKGYVQDVFSKVGASPMFACTLSTVQTPAPSKVLFPWKESQSKATFAKPMFLMSCSNA